MGRAKLPRKSTNVDMTAMCDVAFLLLSFFILATKPKPVEVIPVATPTSISTQKIAEEKVLVTVSKDGKVFLSVENKDMRKEVLNDLNKRLALNLTPAQLKNSDLVDAFGTPFSQLGSFLTNVQQMKANMGTLPGIPTQDSATNELKDWMESAAIVYTGKSMNLSLKGDNVAKYPVVKGILFAFKRNNLNKFNIITGSESVDPTSDYYKEESVKQKK